MFQGCAGPRCRVHVLRNLLSRVTKAGQVRLAARDDVLCLPARPAGGLTQDLEHHRFERLNAAPRGALGNPIQQTPHQRGLATGAPALLLGGTMFKSQESRVKSQESRVQGPRVKESKNRRNAQMSAPYAPFTPHRGRQGAVTQLWNRVIDRRGFLR
jgi:hypothetical protein